MEGVTFARLESLLLHFLTTILTSTQSFLLDGVFRLLGSHPRSLALSQVYIQAWVSG